MTNREKLSKMAFIDTLMYLHLCNPAHGFTVTRCVQYCGDCYKCRMDWLDEPVDVQPDFCQLCGARMDGDEDEDNS